MWRRNTGSNIKTQEYSRLWLKKDQSRNCVFLYFSLFMIRASNLPSFFLHYFSGAEEVTEEEECRWEHVWDAKRNPLIVQQWAGRSDVFTVTASGWAKQWKMLVITQRGRERNGDGDVNRLAFFQRRCHFLRQGFPQIFSQRSFELEGVQASAGCQPLCRFTPLDDRKASVSLQFGGEQNST